MNTEQCCQVSYDLFIHFEWGHIVSEKLLKIIHRNLTKKHEYSDWYKIYICKGLWCLMVRHGVATGWFFFHHLNLNLNDNENRWEINPWVILGYKWMHPWLLLGFSHYSYHKMIAIILIMSYVNTFIHRIFSARYWFIMIIVLCIVSSLTHWPLERWL